jgi:hypothetical protein
METKGLLSCKRTSPHDPHEWKFAIPFQDPKKFPEYRCPGLVYEAESETVQERSENEGDRLVRRLDAIRKVLVDKCFMAGPNAEIVVRVDDVREAMQTE